MKLRRPLQKMVMILIVVHSYNCYCQSGTRTVIDLKNNAVVIPENVKRITVNGALAQMVLMLGCGDKIVATGSGITSNNLLVKIYPDIKKVPAIFGTPGGKSEVNLEGLVKVHPDVVFGENPAISALGIPTLAVSLLNFNDIKRTILLMGNVLGKEPEKKAKEFCNYYDSTIGYISKVTSDLSDKLRPTVFYAGGENGLNTEGKNTIAYSWITTAGGKNVAAENGIIGSKEVSMEQIVVWNPDIIITNSVSGYNEVVNSPKWKKLSAVKNKKVYCAPKGVYLWSVRSAEGVLQIPWAAKVIHSEKYKNVDIGILVKKFYKRFYNYGINDRDVNQILYPADSTR